MHVPMLVRLTSLSQASAMILTSGSLLLKTCQPSSTMRYGRCAGTAMNRGVSLSPLVALASATTFAQLHHTLSPQALDANTGVFEGPEMSFQMLLVVNRYSTMSVCPADSHHQPH